jgi:hypothetical protein
MPVNADALRRLPYTLKIVGDTTFPIKRLVLLSIAEGVPAIVILLFGLSHGIAVFAAPFILAWAAGGAVLLALSIVAAAKLVTCEHVRQWQNVLAVAGSLLTCGLIALAFFR